jgi:hypothetical protein
MHEAEQHCRAGDRDEDAPLDVGEDDCLLGTTVTVNTRPNCRVGVLGSKPPTPQPTPATLAIAGQRHCGGTGEGTTPHTSHPSHTPHRTVKRRCKWARLGSNQRPPACE